MNDLNWYNNILIWKFDLTLHSFSKWSSCHSQFPFLSSGVILEAEGKGQEHPHTPVPRRRGRETSSISLVRCPTARAGFQSLGETRLRLIEVGLRFSYFGCTDQECKSLLKCTNALDNCVVSARKTASSRGGMMHGSEVFLKGS